MPLAIHMAVLTTLEAFVGRGSMGLGDYPAGFYTIIGF